MSSLLTRLKQRRLFQWGIAYAGGAWLLLQLLSLLAQPFAWPDLVIRAAVVVLGVGFVAALVMAWFHGERGAQKAGGIELLMLAALLIVAGAGVALVARDRTDGGAAPTEAGTSAIADTSIQSIAVLPFTNMSDVAGNEYFADGMTEDILTNLAKVASLRVISRTSVMRYKGTQKQTPEIARELGVAHVLEGSVRRAGNQVRITAQLIRARDDAHLWAESYDRDITNIFAVQSEIATAIAQALNARLSSAEGQRIASRPTESIEAYDRYLRARAEYMKISVASSLAAIALLREALLIDPQFAHATALLARAYSLISAPHFTDAEADAERDSALVVGRRAIQLGPNLAVTHSAMAEVLRMQGRYDESLIEMRRTLEIEPNHHWSLAEMGEVLGPYGMGRIDEALSWVERSIKLDPALPFQYILQGESWRQLGDLDRAKKAFEAGLRADPSLPGFAYFRLRLTLQKGDTASARNEIEQLLRLDPDQGPFFISLSYADAGMAAEAARTARSVPASAMAGQPPIARSMFRWLHGDQIGARREVPVWEKHFREWIAEGSQDARANLFLAYAAMIRDKPQEALDQLERYVDQGGRDEALLRQQILLAPLQGEPRMKALQERVHRDLAVQRTRAIARNQ